MLVGGCGSYSSLVADFVQKEQELKKQKEESSDEDTEKKISQEIEITVVKRELAYSKLVREELLLCGQTLIKMQHAINKWEGECRTVYIRMQTLCTK